MTYRLYGMGASLFTARARSYMRINAVPFTEIKAGSTEFTGEIVPQIGRWIIPVVKTPEGAIIQDGADIIDALDKAGFSKNPIYPEDPILLVIAHVFELFGSHGLSKPAMHYRWNFDEVNLAFLRETFRDVLPDDLSPEAEEAAFLNASGRMRQASQVLGVTPETQGQIEESYGEFLALMERHLRECPFILGGHATIADFGLIGAMYAHLGRDPAPLHLMQRRAPNVFRWTERMNMAESFVDASMAAMDGQLLNGTNLPESLLAILRYIAEDYLAEITAHVAHANDWLAKNQDIQTGSSTNNGAMKNSLGMAPFTWRGMDIQTLVAPYRFFLLQRLQDGYARQNADDQSAIRALLKSAGLEPMLDLRTDRRIERQDHQEIWGERQQQAPSMPS